MLPLMRTAWIINRRLLFQFSPWLALYLWMVVAALRRGDPMVVGLTLMFFITLVTTIVTLQGLLLSVEEFILALPVSRSQVVYAKYLSSFLGWVAGVALPLLTACIAHLVVPSHVPGISLEILAMAGLAALYLGFGICLFLPFIYRFGPTKGFTLFSITLATCVAGCIAWKGRDGCFQVFLTLCFRILENRSYACASVAALIIFGMASLCFSIWSYRRR